MARKKSRDKVFNDRPRKVFRKYIGNAEVWFSAFFIVFTVAMGLWFVLQRDNYDPEDRDVSIETLLSQQVEDHLWEPPLLRWVEPGAQFAGVAPVIDLGIFPASAVAGGWTDESAVEVYDETDLFKKINGQETQYRAFGFELLHFLAIRNDEEGIYASIELYDMGEFKNAVGIFAAQRSAEKEVISEGNFYYHPTEVGLAGIVDKYFMKFVGSEERPSAPDHALRMLRDFAGGVDTSAPVPVEYAYLVDGLGASFQDIEYLPNDVFQYDFAKDFWFARQDAEGFKGYLHVAETEEQAVELFNQIFEEHEFEYTLVERDGNNIIFKHDFLKTFITLNQKGGFVFGVEGAPDQEQAIGLVEKLTGTLFKDAA